MDTTEIIHNALEWANKRLELQGEPITENQRNYIVFALRQQLTIPAVVGRSEQCAHPRDKREYIGSNMLRCKVCGKEFS
jgi:hypothetical protein